ncbi:MAG TPA: hypothetical protein VNW15_10490 [Rhizomicrobium sp.]|jgi:hypothetical protein|nr:hypothetical protein [Rhizomicrobium sp.]
MHSKREFLAGIGLGMAAVAATVPAFAQGMKKPAAPAPDDAPRGKALPNRMAKTTKLFKTPGLWPNALATAPEGLWVAQQHLTEGEAKGVNVPWPAKGREQVWLMDMNGKVLKTAESNASNTSGLAFGNGDLYVCSNTDDEASGIHKVNVASGRQVAQLQLPLSPNNRMGGCHGAKWFNGKLWVANNRMRSLMRMDPVSWKAELQIPIYSPPGMGRFHDFTFDKDGTLLQVIANEKSKNHTENVAGLVRMEAETGKPLEIITFVPGSCDPHGLDIVNGQLVGCDAGYHPGWANYDSPSSQWVFKIDLA